MSTESPHWFSDIDPDETLTTHRWQPCLETYAGHVPSIPVWFASEADCDEWIAANLATPHDIAHAVASERADTLALITRASDAAHSRHTHIGDAAGGAYDILARAIEAGAHNHAQDEGDQCASA